MILKSDCIHFPGDRPCSFNKSKGITCDVCKNYEVFKERILIIKLDATGDVLRTTSLLPALKSKYPASHITWITRRNAVPVFFNNPDVNRVLAYEDTETVLTILSENFDILFHPDASKASGKLAELVKAKTKYGYGINGNGVIYPFNQEAVEWYEMGAFDILKKQNIKSYQQILFELCGLNFSGEEIQIFLTEKEMKYSNSFSESHNLKRFNHLIGLNTGAGGRWELKQWRFEGYTELINRLSKKKELGILLYGGPEEIERNRQLASLFPNVIDTGSNNNLRQFFSLVNLCDTFITGDTLGLHVATALKKQIVCLFGPTSYNEIFDYGRIYKVYPEMECLVCYKMRCDFNPNCMDKISANQILENLKKINPIFFGI